MSFESSVNNLLSGIEFEDPRLYDVLSQMAKDLYSAYNQLNPPTTQSFGFTGQLGTTNDVTGFTATIFPMNLRLTWNALGGLVTYEIRYNPGNNTNWDNATVLLKTTTTTADFDPTEIPLVIGQHTFLIKATSTDGINSNNAAVALVTINTIPAPTVTATVIDNFVLLEWTEPTTQLQLEHYHVYKNGVYIGFMKGTFEAIFETSSGSYTYGIIAADIVDNHGTMGTVVADVKQPPDFQLLDTQFSTLTGTKVNTIVEGTNLVACVDTSETWSTHFSSHGWNTIQDQLNAGYDRYCEPVPTTGSYEEVFDIGSILNNIIISVRWDQFQVSGSTSIVCKIAVSDDNITYGAFTTGTAVFAAHTRYVKVRLEFTGSTDKSILLLSNLSMVLDVKHEVDSGDVTAVSTDVGGTEVFFNKTFRDVDSITLTTLATQPVTAIYDFLDVPNPVHFFVYAFDSSGNRVTATVSWKARGIV